MIGSEVLNLLQVLVVKQKGKKNLDFNSLLLLLVVVSYICIRGLNLTLQTIIMEEGSIS